MLTSILAPMRPLLPLLLVTVSLGFVRGDVVNCDNGDRYHGKVLSMDATSVKLQNEITGTLTIPRGRIVGIQLGTAPVRTAQPSATNAPAATSPAPQWDAAAVERIQNEYLATATPEAQQLFQQMVGGLQSGRMSVSDLRAQAATALRDLRAAQKEFGDDALGGILETYGEVLEQFLQRSATAGSAPATRPGRTR